MNRFGAVALFVSILLAVSACSNVYRMQGIESSSISEIAVLEELPNTREFVGVNEVDGKFRGLGLIDRYELIPGDRTLTVRLVKGLASAAPLKLKFTAVAGETYQLKYEIRRVSETTGTWSAWIIRKGDGKSVSEVVR